MGTFLAIFALVEQFGGDAALIAALRGVIAAPSITAALASISFGEWIDIAEKVVAASPEIVAALEKLGPAFTAFAADLKVSKQHAAANINAWFKANAPATIPGYAGDGGVIAIPNPDLKT